jgi:hypothetical protein
MTNNKLTDEQLENISEMAADAAKRYGPEWDSALVGGLGGNFHAVTSDTIQDVVVQANDDSRDSSWLCDYLESLSPAQVLSLVRELQEYRKAQQVVPDFGALTKLIVRRLVDCGGADDDAIARCEEFVYNACRAAMHQGKN